MATANDRRERDAAAGNYAVNIKALTQLVLRQGSSLMTSAEAQSRAIELYRRGVRA